MMTQRCKFLSTGFVMIFFASHVVSLTTKIQFFRLPLVCPGFNFLSLQPLVQEELEQDSAVYTGV